MHEFETNADSVNNLITLLCYAQKKQYAVETDAAVVKWKALAFEILLKKTQRKRNIENEQENDPQKLLDMQMFGAKLNARSNPEKLTLFSKYKKQLEFVRNEAYFQEQPGREILRFLLALQNVQHKTIQLAPELLVPGPFTLHAVQKNRHYPNEFNTDWLHPAPKNFKGVQDINSESDPYAPKFFVSHKLPPLKTKDSTNILPDYGGHITKNAYAEFDNLGLKPRAFRLPVQDEPKTQKSSQEERVFKTFGKGALVEKETMPRCFAWNWESLGCFGIPKNKPFAGEARMSLNLKSIDNMKIRLPFQPKIMSMEQFMQDIKALTVGIQSDTFKHDELLVFHMQSNITVKNLLPSTLTNYVQHFLECGSCFKRMKTMIMKQDYKLLFDGFMFRALCSALDEYLFTFRQFVFAKEDKHLIAYFKRIKKSMQLMRHLSFALAIHPQGKKLLRL